MKESLREKVIGFQKNEITEYKIYKRLAARASSGANGEILREIAGEERDHYRFWRRVTGEKVSPNRVKVIFYFLISLLFGLTFSIKLLERGEEEAQIKYGKVTVEIPEAERIVEEEEEHEQQLIAMIEEERLNYIGSIVLGLNDALVELTGTLAGLTFALRDTELIALTGLITGIAASFSMAASEYLATRSENDKNNALKSSIYTGTAYIITVVMLILPFLLLNNHFMALVFTIIMAILIIMLFNYYVSVARDLNFRKRFLEMAVISLGVALVSFIIGYFIRMIFGVEI